MSGIAIGKRFTDEILPYEQADGKTAQQFREANFAAVDGVAGEDVEPAAARHGDDRIAPFTAESAGS